MWGTKWLGITVIAVAILFTQPFLRDYCNNARDGWMATIHTAVKFPQEATSTSTITKAQPVVYTITPDSTGLKVDAEIFRTYLGSQISMLQDPPPARAPTSSATTTIGNKCVYLFLEVAPSNRNAAVMHKEWGGTTGLEIMRTHCRIMVMVNTDQFTADILDTPHLELLICKTRQCVTFVQQHQRNRIEKIPILFSGFTSMEVVATTTTTATAVENDSAATDLHRFAKFLHVAGSSPHKGTSNILQAWISNPQYPPLTITSHNNKLLDMILKQMREQLGIVKLPPNIHHIDTKLSREEISHIMSRHGVHLCLSGMEGFGHYLNEARSHQALVVTTDYAPMNEMILHDDTGILVPYTNMLEWTNGLPFANVGPVQIIEMMKQVLLPMSLKARAEMATKARTAFEKDRDKFQERMQQFASYLQHCDPSNSGDMVKCAKKFGLQLE